MKKIISGISVVGLLIVMLGADIRRIDSPISQVAPKKKCAGYTIIEFGKAIDCNGDTLKLKRINGVQVASFEE